MKLLINLLIGLLLLGGGITVYEKYSGTKDQMEQYVEKYNTFKAQAEATNKMVDSLKTTIVIEENEAHAAVSRANGFAAQAKTAKNQVTGLKAEEDSLRKAITDSTEMARRIIPKLDTIIAQQDTVILHQDGEIKDLRFAFQKKDTVISLLTFSRDSLQTVINNIPPAPKNPNKMFGITLPSRKVSFIAGTVVGIIAAAVILK
jgi:chromosome segregation ATPase